MPPDRDPVSFHTNHKLDAIRLGVDYYPEHDPESEWDLDAALMQEAGINVIRIGEFCWSRMQTPDGVCTLDWLERCVDLFAKRGISTILCTPSATPPVWVVERYPDLIPQAPDGRRWLFGGRRHYSVFHDGYRGLSLAIARGLAQRFARHPSVVGWYIDNEVGSYASLDVSPPAQRAWHRHLQRRFGAIDALNRAFGLIFWNQELQRFDQCPVPTLVLEYNRFCLQGLAQWIYDQASAIRDEVDPGQFVMSSCIEPVEVVLHEMQRQRGRIVVDYGSVNTYPELCPTPGQAAMRLDRYRGITSPTPFLVPEMQSGSGHSTTNGLDHATRRYWTLEAIARGGRLICWFHWRRFRTGVEWKHFCIVERDRGKRGPFLSVQDIIRDIRRIEPLILNATVQPDVQVLFSLENALARDCASEPMFWMEIQQPDGFRHRLPLWEKEMHRAAWLPMASLGLTVGFVLEDQPFDPALPLIVTDLDLCPDSLLAKLEAYCRDGGTLICFPGAGERDEHGAHGDAPPPGKLAGLFGVSLADYHPIQERGHAIFDAALGRLIDSEAPPEKKTFAWARIGDTLVELDIRHGEILDPSDAQILGRFEGGPCDGRPVITSREIGRGRAVYLGAPPATTEQAVRLYQALISDLPPRTISYRIVKLRAAAGAMRFLLNDSPVAVPLPAPVQDVITGQTRAQLPPYAAVLVRD